jgi:hypothetical protein
MGLLDFHADSIERNALARPSGPAPEPTFSTWAATKAMGGGVPAGLMEGLGAVRDFSRGVDEQRAAELKAKEARTGIPQHQNPMMPGGGSLRKKADEFMPDPLAAHWSAQVLGGFSKSLTKAGAAMVVAGPTGGAAIFGAMEADDTAQRLIDKGIDSKTAWQVGGVVGVTSAIGARLPISGAAMASTAAGKVGATAALGVVGGPGSYMAQEGLAREILQRAGHADEAKLHDPLNPIGLGASMFPLVLGGFAVRGALRKPLKTEADARAAAQFTPEEQAKIDAFERSAGNLAELEAAIKTAKRPEDKALLVAELEKQRGALAKGVRETAANRAAADPLAVDAARVKVLDETVARNLPVEPQAHAQVMRAADMVAAAERVDVPPMALPEAFPELPRLTGADLIGKTADELDLMHMDAVTHNRTVDIEGIRKFFGAEQAAKAEAMSKRAREKWLEKNVTEEADDWMQARYINDELIAEHRNAAGNFDNSSPEALGRSIALVSRSIDEPGFFQTPDGVTVAAALQHARDMGWDMDKVLGGMRGRAVQWAGDDAPELFRRMFQAAQEKPQPIARPELSQNPALQASRSPDAQPIGAQAADQPAASQTISAEATKSPDAALAKTLADVNPEIPVRLPGDEKNTTLAAALERIKEEQAADMQMADLYKVATTCFLTGGAAT